MPIKEQLFPICQVKIVWKYEKSKQRDKKTDFWEETKLYPGSLNKTVWNRTRMSDSNSFAS